MEIERKYILKDFPSGLNEISHHIVEQLYISTNPEVRLRRRFDTNGDIQICKVSVKSNGDIIREEYESIIDNMFFENVRDMLGHKPIIKDYHRYEYKGHILEVSKVDNDWIYAEVEFDDLDEANAFVMDIPEALEVTYDKSYKMVNYWAETRLGRKL